MVSYLVAQPDRGREWACTDCSSGLLLGCCFPCQLARAGWWYWSEDMSPSQLVPNVEAYEPEADPANIDLDSLEARKWPRTVLECVRRQQLDSDVLRAFERLTAERYWKEQHG
jgi:hypothetical protein